MGRLGGLGGLGGLGLVRRVGVRAAPAIIRQVGRVRQVGRDKGEPSVFL